MTRYWIKIVFGALLIFAVGMAVWLGVRKGVDTVRIVIDTAEPITIPIKVVDFRVDGASLGRLQTVRILRSAPKAIESVEVTVRLDSAASAERLRDCTLRIDDLEQLDERTTFVCVSADAPAAAGEFEAFGQVLVEGTDIIIPLLLPVSVVREMQNKGWQGADSMAPAAPHIPAVPEVKIGGEATAGATAPTP